MTAVLAGISLGANLEAPLPKLKEAINSLRKNGLLSVAKISSVYLSSGDACPPQPPFYNQVILAKCGLAPRELLDYLLKLESSLGRKRNIPKGPRIIDIDLLFYGNSLFSSSRLTLPHRAIPERLSILAPLCEVFPFWKDPASGKSARELLAAKSAGGKFFSPFPKVQDERRPLYVE